MPLADFTITVHAEPERAVRVVVYKDIRHLRAAATRYDNRRYHHTKRKRNTNAHTLGICHRFEISRSDDTVDPLCAIVRLAEPHLGVGIVSHEMAHAAVWINELDTENDPAPLVADNDEPFCLLLGDLVRQTINAMNERGVYDD